jgi:hypothetical protein
MALTVSLPGDWLINIGNRRQTVGTITFDSNYQTGGMSLTAPNVGLGILDFINFNEVSGFAFEYVASTQKVKVYVDGGNLPTVTVVGGQGATSGLQISPDSNAGVLGKTQATTRTIPGGTFGLVAVPAQMVEVAGGTNLSTLVAGFQATGR